MFLGVTLTENNNEVKTVLFTHNDQYLLFTVKFCTEIDLEIIRIVKHIKKTASFFKFRNTKTKKQKHYSGNKQHFRSVIKNEYFYLKSQ